MLFVVAHIVTFTFITLLQLGPKPLFLVFLILMHVGIALFIISKKCFIRNQKSIKRYYMIAYLLLSFYLPFLIYKLLSRWLPYDYNEALVLYGTLSVTVIAIIVSAINNIKLYKYLKKV